MVLDFGDTLPLLKILVASFAIVVTFSIAFVVYSGIKGRSAQNSYMIAMCVSAAISFVLYVVLGFIASKADKNGKLGNWF